jgi:FKBP-type peptidyl-prolyl cis-trans isomerase FkpA
MLALFLMVTVAGCGKKTEKSGTQNGNVATGIPEIVVPADTTETGLVIQEIEEGSGKKARLGNYVTVHYSGWFADGKLFDSSIPRNKPFTIKLGAKKVIAGWEEGIQGMKVGGKRRLTIPPDLAYGENGYPNVIPPQATLIFDIELLSVR